MEKSYVGNTRRKIPVRNTPRMKVIGEKCLLGRNPGDGAAKRKVLVGKCFLDEGS
jgi:hypothetical protein